MPLFVFVPFIVFVPFNCGDNTFAVFVMHLLNLNISVELSGVGYLFSVAGGLRASFGSFGTGVDGRRVGHIRRFQPLGLTKNITTVACGQRLEYSAVAEIP